MNGSAQSATRTGLTLRQFYGPKDTDGDLVDSFGDFEAADLAVTIAEIIVEAAARGFSIDSDGNFRHEGLDVDVYLALHTFKVTV